MEHYEKYKNSNIEWLGLIPDSWSLKRAKDIAHITRGAILRPVDDPNYFDDKGQWLYLNISDVTGGNKYLYDAKLRLSKLGSTRSARVYANNVIITASATIGIPFINKVNVCIHDGFIPFTKSKLNIEFLFYYLMNENIYSALGKSNTQKNIYLDEAKNIAFAFPPLTEQIQIATFLDTKTQAIDKKINLLTTKIEYYKELRKTIINNAVTKGLDKNAILKESEFNIPTHWHIKRVKDVYKTYTGNSIPDRGLYEIKENSRFYISTKDIDFDTGLINYDNGTYIQITDKEFKIAYKNSTLICLEGASAGNKIGFTTADICFVNKLCCVRGNENRINNKYFYYFTLSEAFKQQFFGVLNGMIGGVSMNLLKNFNIVQPPKEEQAEIAIYLDAKTSTIDKITTNLQTQINILKELRKTLINDVVTGKIKVN